MYIVHGKVESQHGRRRCRVRCLLFQDPPLSQGRARVSIRAWCSEYRPHTGSRARSVLRMQIILWSLPHPAPQSHRAGTDPSLVEEGMMCR